MGPDSSTTLCPDGGSLNQRKKDQGRDSDGREDNDPRLEVGTRLHLLIENSPGELVLWGPYQDSRLNLQISQASVPVRPVFVGDVSGTFSGATIQGLSVDS